MSDNPPPNPPPNESASTSGDGPRAKKAKTSHSQSSESIAHFDTARGGSRKATLKLDIDDVVKFSDENLPVDSEKVTLSGFDWRITAEIVDGYLSVMLKGSHPSMSEWHCKVDFTLRESADKKAADEGITIFTHSSPSCGYDKWFSVEELVDDFVDFSVTCEMTTFNCYVTDGAFGCRSRFHDVTFDFGQRHLYGNKGFLAANAEHFEAMFFGDFVDKSKDVVTLKKVKADDFAEFLKALAPGPMPISGMFQFRQMSDNPPPNPPANETSGDSPRAKKAKTSPSKSSESIARLDTARGGSRKATLKLDIEDVEKFKADNVKVEGDKVTLSGIDWRITVEIVDGYLSLMLRGSHPCLSEWHCKVNFNVRKPSAKRSNDEGVLTFTHKASSWGYNKWMPVEKLIADYDKLSVSFEMTTFTCYVTDGAFGCRSRFHDVTFDFGQRHLYGNRGFLAANAEHFEAMFFGDFADKNKEVVILKRVKADDFADFLKALAPIPMPISDKTVITVLRMADRFQAHALVERCTNFLLRDKGLEFVKKLQVADELLMSHLRDRLIEDASMGDIKNASKSKNESKFSKLTWIKLFHAYMRLRDGSSDSEDDSDA